MFEQAIHLFERLVISQEEIAAALKAQPGSLPDRADEPLPEEQNDRRGFLKAKLIELGVDFNDRTNTAKLEKIFREELARLEQKAKEEDEKVITLEEVRAELKAFAAKNGIEEAKAVLKNYGASQLPEVPESRYARLLAELRRG